MVEWKWKANSIDRVASPIGAELVSVVVEIVKKVEAEEKLAEKDKELKVRGDFILNCCNLHCTSDNCPMRPECSIYLKNHPKE